MLLQFRYINMNFLFPFLLFSEYFVIYLYHFSYKYNLSIFFKIIIDISLFVRYNKLNK